MPTALIELPATTDAPRKRWTREEYHRLSGEGMGWENLELVDGELVGKMGKKRPHVNAAVRLQVWLQRVFGALSVQPEGPIDLSPQDNPTNEPQPDLIVTRGDVSHFEAGNPRPADLLLVVEVSDTTLGFDLTTKARLYARAGIGEYWVLDVVGRRMIVHREPREGQYRAVAVYGEEERLAPLAAPGSELPVRDVFPEQAGRPG